MNVYNTSKDCYKAATLGMWVANTKFSNDYALKITTMLQKAQNYKIFENYLKFVVVRESVSVNYFGGWVPTQHAVA